MDDIEKIKEKVEESKKAESTEIAERKEDNPVATVNIPKIEFEIDTKKSYSEQAKDVVGVMATQKALQDEGLVKDITEKKKDELKENADKTLKEEKVKGKNAETELQKANYGVYEGVATYAGIKKPLPNLMQKILFTILSILQTLWLIVFGTGTSIINITLDCLNGIITKLSEVAKAARLLFFVLITVGLVSVIALIVVHYLRKAGIIN